MHWRTILYVLLALAVPTGAFALTGDDDGAQAESLSVSASLDSCGIAADSIVCKIDASWNEVPGATRYTASVARADGSVVDYGDVGAGSASFWVPYTGNGTYTVTVSAYGTPPGAADPEVIAKASSSAGRAGKQSKALDGGEIAATDPGDPADETDATGDPGCTEPPAEPEPEEPPAEPEPDDQATAEGDDAAAAALAAEPEATEPSAAAEQALEDEAQTPEPGECPAG